MTPAQFRTYPGPAVLAEAAASEMLDAILAAQAERGEAHALLTGGRIGIATLKALAALERVPELDRAALHVWWGDERFVPLDERTRNDGAARLAFGRAMRVPEENWHAMPAPSRALKLDRAAERYEAELAGLRATRGPLPLFDIGLLSLGPDGHIASLFPGSVQVLDTSRLAVPVFDAPKPPPQRISLTIPALSSCGELLLLASGSEKAAAVRATLDGPEGVRDPLRPASMLAAPSLTWLIDADARLGA